MAIAHFHLIHHSLQPRHLDHPETHKEMFLSNSFSSINFFTTEPSNFENSAYSVTVKTFFNFTYFGTFSLWCLNDSFVSMIEQKSYGWMIFGQRKAKGSKTHFLELSQPQRCFQAFW
jgi:hypothetical protein